VGVGECYIFNPKGVINMVSVAPYSVVEMLIGIWAMYGLVILATLVRINREGREDTKWVYKDGKWDLRKLKFGWLYGLVALVVVIILSAFPIRFGTVMLINGCAIAMLVREIVLSVRLVVKW